SRPKKPLIASMPPSARRKKRSRPATNPKQLCRFHSAAPVLRTGAAEVSGNAKIKAAVNTPTVLLLANDAHALG
ncbi:MAG: hypothetical protein ACYTF0_03540, partial [Planctomycetota bacterium]